ncbi:expressed unknown protein [Ectocarpus siliculosus]|uniref:Uncharacterized protein n=1 Tax=Ectocarpus siliculosus TaxID=2880 RepID=D8LCR5_ECTSI|nr:expressed unknown protein [Ectocarpus siliculosus]|eukprot:CBN79578.1 expressed unknown protein [Ectocarpus siliculosus]
MFCWTGQPTGRDVLDAPGGNFLLGVFAASWCNLCFIVYLSTCCRWHRLDTSKGPVVHCVLLLWAFTFELAEGVLLYLLEDDAVPVTVAVVIFVAPAALSTALLFVAHRSLGATLLNFAVEAVFAYLTVSYVVEKSATNWLIFGSLGLNEAVVATALHLLESRKAESRQVPESTGGGRFERFLSPCCQCFERFLSSCCLMFQAISIPVLPMFQAISILVLLAFQAISLLPVFPVLPVYTSWYCRNICSYRRYVMVEDKIKQAFPLGDRQVSGDDMSGSEVVGVATIFRDLFAKGASEVLFSVLTPLLLRYMYRESVARSTTATALYVIGPFVDGVVFKMKYKEPFTSVSKFKKAGKVFLVVGNACYCVFRLFVLATTVANVGWRPFDTTYAIVSATFSAVCMIPKILDWIVGDVPVAVEKNEEPKIGESHRPADYIGPSSGIFEVPHPVKSKAALVMSVDQS